MDQATRQLFDILNQVGTAGLAVILVLLFHGDIRLGRECKRCEERETKCEEEVARRVKLNEERLARLEAHDEGKRA